MIKATIIMKKRMNFLGFGRESFFPNLKPIKFSNFRRSIKEVLEYFQIPFKNNDWQVWLMNHLVIYVNWFLKNFLANSQKCKAMVIFIFAGISFILVVQHFLWFDSVKLNNLLTHNQIQSYWSIFRGSCTARIATSRTIISISIVATNCQSEEDW